MRRAGPVAVARTGLRSLAGIAALGAACAGSGCTAPSDGLVDGAGCGDCTVLASAQPAPAAIVAQGSGVFWIDRGVATGSSYESYGDYVGGAILAASSDGHVSVLVSSVESSLLAVSAAGVFFDARDPATGTTASVLRIGQDGSGAGYVASGLSKLVLLAADDTSVYWVADAQASGGRSATAPTLFRAAPDGSNVTVLASLSSPTALAVDDAGLYLVDGTTLERMNKDGTGTTPLVTLGSLQGTAGLAIDGTSVYWSATGSSSGAILAADEQGGGVRVVTSGLPSSMAGLAVHDGSLYFSTVSASFDSSSDSEKVLGQIDAVSATGGAPRLLASYALSAGASSSWVVGLAAGSSRVFATTLVSVASGDPQGAGDVVSVPE